MRRSNRPAQPPPASPPPAPPPPARGARPRRPPAPEVTLAPIGARGVTRGGLVQVEDGQSYLFTTDVAEYRIALGAPDERNGLLRIDGRLLTSPVGQAIQPAQAEAPLPDDEAGAPVEESGPPQGAEWQPLLRAAGMLFREEEGAVLPPHATAERCELVEVRPSARGRILVLRYTERAEDRTLRRSVQVRLNGRSLEITVEAPGGRPGEGYCGFALGPLGPDVARFIHVPGLPDPLLPLPGGGFLGAYADRFLGRADSYPPGGAFYRTDTEGVSAPIAETFYLTLSDDPLDSLPALARPPAPYRAQVENRVTLDYFSEAPYEEDRELLSLLPEYGLQDVLLVYRNWQQFGYRCREPLFYPANPDRGSNEQFRRLLLAAQEAGWLVALRQEYATVTSDSPYWAEKALALWPDGLPRLSRCTGQYGVRPEAMLDFARLEATKIERNYRPSAVFVDGHTAWSPEGYFRQVTSTPHSGGEAQAIRYVEGLLAFLRDVHEGPVIGSAGDGPVRFDTFSEGMAEAVVRGPDAGRTAPLIVDYELREVRPKLLGIGAGTYRQFSNHPTGEPVDSSRIDWDAYRATEIALGHAGYIGNYRIKPGPRGVPYPGGSAATVVREYYLLRALQELYLQAPVRSIAYRHGEEMLPLAEALRRGADLVQAQVRIEYGNGLTVWVNRSSRSNWIVEAEEARWELPPNGFLALAPRQKLVAYSALVGGNRADFCRCDLYTFVDVRGYHPRRVEEIATDGAVALLPGALPGRPDVVLAGARQAVLGEEEYRLSERGDVRISFLSDREVELTVMDTETGKHVHASWPAFTPAWSTGKFEVLERREGPWQPSRCQVNQTRSGPQLARALPGMSYCIRVMA